MLATQIQIRTPDDFAIARLAVAKQLARHDVPAGNQRAYLMGLLAGLEWGDGTDGAKSGGKKVVEDLIAGRQVIPAESAHIAGPLPNQHKRLITES